MFSPPSILISHEVSLTHAMTRFTCVSLHRPLSNTIDLLCLSIGHFSHRIDLHLSLTHSLYPSLSLSPALSLSRTPLSHTLDVSSKYIARTPARTHTVPLLDMPLSLLDTHAISSPLLGLHHQWSLFSTHTLSLFHTRAHTTDTDTDTHTHHAIYLDPSFKTHTLVYSLQLQVYIYPYLSLSL
jgi:hypothetical protein